MKAYRLAGALVTVTVALAACSGGSGSGSPNNAPVAINDGPFQVNSSATLTVNGSGVLANDSDKDNDSLTAVLVSPPAAGTLEFNADGSFAYTPDAGSATRDSFFYKASDGKSESNPATVIIDINIPPVAHAGEDFVATVNTGVSLDGTQSSDANAGDVLSFQWRQIGGQSVVLTDADSATPGFFTPATPQILTFELTVTDSGGETAVDSVQVTANLSPVAADSCEGTPFDTTLNGDLNALVTDPDSTVFVFAAASPAPGLGSVSIHPSGTFVYTPTPGSRGYDSFGYRVSDAVGGSDQGTITVVVSDTRIMPLGDSLTLGRMGNGNMDDSIQVAYRRKLYDDLTDDLDRVYFFDFVGSQIAGEAATPPIPDPDHEGHSGFKASQIAPVIFAWLDANPADAVLLHIGTNDINDDFIGTAAAKDGMIGDVNDILRNIDAWEIGVSGNPVTVFLAQIIDRERASGQRFPNPRVQQFNGELALLAQERILAGDDIILVDQYNALVYPGDMEADGVHPRPIGYDKMGDTWYLELDAWGEIFSCPR